MVTMADRMTKLEIKTAKIETKVDYIAEKLDDFIACADKKFASKLTEKIVYAMIGMILIGFMTKLLGMW